MKSPRKWNIYIGCVLCWTKQFICIYTYLFIYLYAWSRDNAVGIATGYGLDCPGIESRWGRDFAYLSRLALRPTQPPIQWVPCLSGDKAAGAWRWSPTPSSAEVKERVELYLYPLWAFVACSRVNLTFFIYRCVRVCVCVFGSRVIKLSARIMGLLFITVTVYYTFSVGITLLLYTVQPIFNSGCFFYSAAPATAGGI
jgi:hypothetical protein